MFGVHERESALRVSVLPAAAFLAARTVATTLFKRSPLPSASTTSVRCASNCAPSSYALHRAARQFTESIPAMTLVVRAALTDQPILLAEHEELVSHQAAGAVVGFVGDDSRPRRRTPGGAAGIFRAPVGRRCHRRSGGRGRRAVPGARAVAASHRIGVLQIGEAALVAAVAADHRQAAFATCAQLVDAIKARLPVWKRQFFADGTDEWVGST